MSAGGTTSQHLWGVSKTQVTTGMKILRDGSEHKGREILAVQVEVWPPGKSSRTETDGGRLVRWLEPAEQSRCG